METHVRTPQDVFMQPQHLVVPPFQRPYVWEKEEQWAPLWQDVRRLAELRLAQPSADAKHFLGAIVVQAQEPILGDLQASSIIDGQQRLTTLQVLMDATAAALEAVGEDALAGQLDRLTHNEDIYVPGAKTRLKLRHSNKDRDAFDEVMDAEAPVDHEALRHSAARVVRAHEYFTGAVIEWLDSAADGAAERAQALAGVLTRGLQLVAINLTVNENSQEIFETLNARGTPLTAADLIRNFVFQRLAAEGADTRAHLDEWPFETEFWEKEVSVGRYPMQRSSLFFNQWLIARVGEEISPRATFTRFKQYVEQVDLENGQKVADLLPLIRQQAETYEAWTTAASEGDRQLNRVELAVYRMKASDTELLKPLLIWLHEPGREVPADVIDRVVSIVESWLVRRQLLRLSIGDMGRIVADIIRAHERTPPTELAGSIEALSVAAQRDQHILAGGCGDPRGATDRAGVPPLQEGATANAPRGHRGRTSARDQPAASAAARISDRAHPPAEVGRTLARPRHRGRGGPGRARPPTREPDPVDHVVELQGLKRPLGDQA